MGDDHDELTGILLAQAALLTELSKLLIETYASVDALTELAIDLRAEQGYERERTQEWLKKLRAERGAICATRFEEHLQNLRTEILKGLQ